MTTRRNFLATLAAGGLATTVRPQQAEASTEGTRVSHQLLSPWRQQKLFITSTADIAVAFGKRGCGKTWALLYSAADFLSRHERARGAIVTNSVLAYEQDTAVIVSDFGAQYQWGSRRWVFPNGSELFGVEYQYVLPMMSREDRAKTYCHRFVLDRCWEFIGLDCIQRMSGSDIRLFLARNRKGRLSDSNGTCIARATWDLDDYAVPWFQPAVESIGLPLQLFEFSRRYGPGTKAYEEYLKRKA